MYSAQGHLRTSLPAQSSLQKGATMHCLTSLQLDRLQDTREKAGRFRG